MTQLPFKKAGSKRDSGKIRERTLFDMSPPWSVNIDGKMCSRANLGKLAEDNFDLPEYSLDVEVNIEAELNELKVQNKSN